MFVKLKIGFNVVDVVLVRDKRIYVYLSIKLGKIKNFVEFFLNYFNNNM